MDIGGAVNINTEVPIKDWAGKNIKTMLEDFTCTFEITDSSGLKKLSEDFNQKRLKALRDKYCPLDSIGTGSWDVQDDRFVIRCFLKETYEVICDVEVFKHQVGEYTFREDADFLAKVAAYEYLQSKKNEEE